MTTRIHVHADQGCTVVACETIGAMVVQVNGRGSDISLHLSWDQANRLHAQLDALLMDRQRQAHPETCACEAEVIDVMDPANTLTAEQLRAAIKGG